MSELNTELEKIKRACLKVIPEPCTVTAENAALTRFAGSAYAEKGETAPVCPVCKKPLSFVFQYEDKENDRLIVFYYCFFCTPIGSKKEPAGSWLVKAYNKPDKSKFEAGSGVDSKLRPCLCHTEKIFVLPDYETIENNYPEIAELCEDLDPEDPMSAYEDAGIEIGCEMEPCTTIGGYPIWIQGESSKECPECGKPANFIAQIDSQAEAELMWGDAGCVYLFQCPDHKEQFDMEMQCF